MTSFPLRCAALAVLALLTVGCQSQQAAEPAPAPATDAAAPGAQEQFEARLAAGQLAEAEAQLPALQAEGDSAAQLQAQRQLSEAYLQEGQKALEAGDLDKAAKSLAHARTLMPKAPALTTGLDGAIGKVSNISLDPTKFDSIVTLSLDTKYKDLPADTSAGKPTSSRPAWLMYSN